MLHRARLGLNRYQVYKTHPIYPAIWIHGHQNYRLNLDANDATET